MFIIQAIETHKGVKATLITNSLDNHNYVYLNILPFDIFITNLHDKEIVIPGNTDNMDVTGAVQELQSITNPTVAGVLVIAKAKQ